MSLAEYLAFEEQSSVKHYYVAGELCAMSGTTFRHGIYEDLTLPPLTVREENEWNEAEWADYVVEDR